MVYSISTDSSMSALSILFDSFFLVPRGITWNEIGTPIMEHPSLTTTHGDRGNSEFTLKSEKIPAFLSRAF